MGWNGMGWNGMGCDGMQIQLIVGVIVVLDLRI